MSKNPNENKYEYNYPGKPKDIGSLQERCEQLIGIFPKMKRPDLAKEAQSIREQLEGQKNDPNEAVLDSIIARLNKLLNSVDLPEIPT